MRVPPELEGLLWELAENPVPSALDEFGERYPELRAELGRRIATVRSLKGARPTGSRPPAFQPRPPARTTWRPLPALAGLLALVALGVAGYWGAERISPRSAQVPEPPVSAPVDPIEGFPQAEPVREKPLVQAPSVPQSPPRETAPTVPNPAPTPSELYAYKPISLQVNGAPLQGAIQLAAANVGLRVDFAPGMINPQVSTDYRGVSARDILGDLGREYGFTVFDQGDGSLLVIPAVEGPAMRTNPGVDHTLPESRRDSD